jgi:glycine/D-amino acid oxidase-like deaminating enzyme
MNRRHFNLTTALHLARKGMGVIVLEAREPG